MTRMERRIAETLADKADRLSAEFEARAATHDDCDTFVAENFQRLGEEGLLAVGVPADLGGGDATLDQLADMLRRLAQGCGSTALALAMHSHGVATPAWRWRNQPQARAAVEPVLRKVAAGAVLVTSGGSDWVGGAGQAEKVAGGYRITARKVFASCSPVGSILTTSVLCGDQVIHFALPLDQPEVRKMDNWHTLDMRGTGSQDLMIDNLFLPEGKVILARPAGRWHPLWHMIATNAMPLIYAVYLGLAEGARRQALTLAAPRAAQPATQRLAGEMETALFAARAAHRAMLAAAQANPPGEATVNPVMMGRRLVEEAAIRTVELAMELAGGAGFFRDRGLERRFRDIQAARYHPMRREAQHAYAGALALGQPVDTVF
ncbi:MAG: acyl-CoA dehydrogenase family protein [Paracoccaceae bacterium]